MQGTARQNIAAVTVSRENIAAVRVSQTIVLLSSLVFHKASAFFCSSSSTVLILQTALALKPATLSSSGFISQPVHDTFELHQLQFHPVSFPLQFHFDSPNVMFPPMLLCHSVSQGFFSLFLPSRSSLCMLLCLLCEGKPFIHLCSLCLLPNHIPLSIKISFLLDKYFQLWLQLLD